MYPVIEILTNSKFYVSLYLGVGLDMVVDAFFMECQGFERTQEVIEIVEVMPQKWGKANSGFSKRTKIPGNSTCNNLILKRGMTFSTSMWKWLKSVEDGNWADKRRDGAIEVYNQMSIPIARFEFLRAWPTKYKIGDLSVTNSDFEVEELELAVEDFYRVDSVLKSIGRSLTRF